MNENGRSRDSVLFVSKCPTCMRDQAQGYSRGDLRRLMGRGHPVEAYCMMCDEYWPLSPPERASLMAELAPS